MKFFLFYSILLICLNSFGKSAVTLHGTILNFTGNAVSLYISTNNISENLKQECEVDKNGDFKFEIEIEGSKPAIFSTGKNNIGLFITEGDSIVFTYDFNNIIESMEFSGNRASHYRYFIDYYSEFNLPHAMFTKPDLSDVFNMSPIEFKTYRKLKVESDLTFLEKFVSAHNVTNEFKQYCEIEIRYSYYYALASYASLRKYFKNISDTLPNEFYYELSKDLFNIDEYIISENYCRALERYLDLSLSEIFTDPVSYYNRAFNLADKELTNKSLHFYKAYSISNLLGGDAPNSYKDSIVADFIHNSIYSDYTASITDLYSNSLRTRNKKIPVEVLDTEISTVEGRNLSLGKILETYKNKVVYIDVWASFCGPCKVEMPYSEKLKQNLTNRNVVFIYLSIDANLDNWKKAMDTWGVSGENYVLKEGLNSTFAKYFNINGIPHYILIDKEGNIVFPSAARPSSESIKYSILTLCE